MKYDLVIIGAGPGGYVCAIRASQLGMKTAVIENREAGGTCLNRGCIPTKSLLQSAKTYQAAIEAEKLGIKVKGIEIDIEAVFARKKNISDRLQEGIEQLFEANGIDYYKATARLERGHAVSLWYDDESQKSGNRAALLNYDKLIIASGSVPFIPPIPGSHLPGVLTSDELLNLHDRIPKSLVIIGGGVIAVEFAQVYASFGTKVTILERMPAILPMMDKDISRNLSIIMKKRGVAIHTDAAVEEIRKSEDGLLVLFEKKGKKQEISCENILAAVGRAANTKELFGEDIQIISAKKTEGASDELLREKQENIVVLEKGKILTDENQGTSMQDVYAIGDVTKAVQLAHVASAQGICTAEHLASLRGLLPEGRKSIDLNVIPSCVYTSPEIACVGLTEKEAVKQGYSVRCGRFMTSGNGKSVIAGEEGGFVKVVFDEQSDMLLGAQLMCARATDMIGELATAIANSMTSDMLLRAMKAHPTVNEAVREAVEASHGGAIHIAP